MSEKGRIGKGQKEMFPHLRKANEEVYLFMRGKKDMLGRIKNAFVLEKRGVENYNGKFIGVSDDIVRYEGDCYAKLPEQYMAIIRFEDMDKARRWTEHSSKFKQKDFPTPADEVEMFAVPIQYIPQEDLSAFQLTEMHELMVEPEDFSAKYVQQVCPLLNKRRIYHGVVATSNVIPLRSCRIRRNTYILLNCAKSLNDLKEHYYSEEYDSYKKYRQEAVAENDTCFFTIKPFT